MLKPSPSDAGPLSGCSSVLESEVKQLDLSPAGVDRTIWKAGGSEETKIVILRGEEEVIGADLLMYKKKTFVEAVTCVV